MRFQQLKAGKRRLLFVTRDASRTGAPFLLLYLLRWLRENTKVDFDVVVGRTGPLDAEFAKLAPLFVLEHSNEPVVRRLVNRAGSYRLQQWVDRSALSRALRGNHFALIYSNTLVNGRLL